MGKIRTAVVGVGALGRHHLRWLSRLPESNLVGCFDIDQEKSKQHAAEYGVTPFESLSSLAKEAEAVSVVVPTRAHFEVASFLIKNGCHCLIEKPVTATNEEAQALIRLAAGKKLVITVGQIERFNPAVVAIRNNGLHPSFIEAHRLAAFDPRGTDVAVVLDLMIHDIDLVLMLVGSKVTDIQASAVAVISDQTDIANARISFENGAVANLTASRISLSAMRKLRIFQKSGYISLDLEKKQADIYRLAEPGQKMQGIRLPLGKSDKEIVYTKISDSGEDMLSAELSSFLRAVASGTAPEVSLEEACESLRIAHEVETIGRRSSDRMLEEKSV